MAPSLSVPPSTDSLSLLVYWPKTLDASAPASEQPGLLPCFLLALSNAFSLFLCLNSLVFFRAGFGYKHISLEIFI